MSSIFCLSSALKLVPFTKLIVRSNKMNWIICYMAVGDFVFAVVVVSLSAGDNLLYSAIILSSVFWPNILARPSLVRSLVMVC